MLSLSQPRPLTPSPSPPTRRTSRRGHPRHPKYLAEPPPSHLHPLAPAELDRAPLFWHTQEALALVEAHTGRIRAWNPAAERLFGYAPAEARRRTLSRLLPPSLLPLARPERPLEVPVPTKAGQLIPVELRVIPVAHAEPPTVLVSFTDARPRHQAEQQALALAHSQAAQQALEDRLDRQTEQLKAGLDQLHRPTQRLRHSALRLELAAHQTPQLARQVQVVQARIQQLLETTQQLQDSLEAELDSLHLEPRRTNLVPLLGRLIAQARRRFRHHTFKLATPQGLTALVDPARLDRVLLTLLDRAARRCPHGGWIDVELSRPLVGLARLEIRSYGRAATPATDPARLFAPQHGDRGLFLSRTIVQQHGGTLTADTLADGTWRLVLTLPTQRARVAEMAS